MVKLTKVPAAAWTLTTPKLWVYDSALLGAPGPRIESLVWRTEAHLTALGPPRRPCWSTRAPAGSALHFDSNAHAKQRYVCDVKNVRIATEECVAPYQRIEGGAATGITDVDRAYEYAGITYDFFATKFGRDSLDGKGPAAESSVRYCSTDPRDRLPVLNAFWNGKQML